MSGKGFTPLVCESRDGSVLIEKGAAVNFQVAATSGAGASFVPPGPDRAAAIDALVAAGTKTLLFGVGDYELEAELFAGMTPAEISGVRLVGMGQDLTRFTATYAPVVGEADLPTNALVPLFGAPDGVVATTVLALSPAQYETRTFRVTSAAGIASGMFLRVMAHNAPGVPNDMSQMSDGASVVLTEMVEVESVLGDVVTLVSPLKQWHTPGAAVESVDPVLDVVVRGIFFDCAGGSVACAVSASLMAFLTVEGCSFRGFSRAAVDLEDGTRSVVVSDFRARGELNCMVLGDSAMVVEVRDGTWDEQGPRFHANGIARHQVKLYERCTDWVVRDCLIQHACAAVSHWGGVNLQFQNLRLRDMDPARIHATDPDYGPVGRIGVGLDSGAGPLGIESVSWGVQYSGVQMHDTFGTTVGDYAWYLHDCTSVQISDCAVMNHGPVYGTVVDGVTFTPRGLLLSDAVTVVGESVEIYGCGPALETAGTPGFYFDSLLLDGVGGNGPTAAALPVVFNHSANTSSRITRLLVQNYNTATFTFGASFLAVPDWTLRFDYYSNGGFFEWADVTLYKSNAAAGGIGAVMEIDPTSPVGEKRVIASVAASARCVAVCDGMGANAFTFCAPLPSRLATISVTGAGVAGDILESNAANQGVVNNAAVDGTRIGRLQESKAAGVGFTKIVSVN